MEFGRDAPGLLVLALALDAVLGDPDWLWRRWPHPVAWLGRLVGFADLTLNREAWGEPARRLAGMVALVGLLAVAIGAGWLAERALLRLPGGAVLVGLAASVLLAQRSLCEHVGRVGVALARGLPEGRASVAMIVGRKPESLDGSGVARAAIESLAENLSDGVVAPAFWFAVAGLPGLAAYKAINTADSMIGHLSARHRAFGWASARLDDLVNLVPARLTALLLAGAAPLAGGSAGAAIRTAWRDAGLHRSPNAGWPESAMAGALGLALGGTRVYASGPVDEPFLNEAGRRAAGPAEIGRALRVAAGAMALHAALYGALWLALR